MPRAGQFKHVIVYAAYVVYALDDGLYLAETRYQDDEFQVWSCDLREMFRALDLIEDVLDDPCHTRPSWLERYLGGVDDVVVLPSACSRILTPLVLPIRPDPDYIHPYDVEADLRSGRIYRSLPSRIAREFGLFKLA